MKKISGIILLFCFIFMISGCATIFKGAFRDVRFNSDPEGAQVYINGEFFGNTPVKIELKPKESYVIEFRKEGFEPVVHQLKIEIGVGWVVLDVVCGLVPVLVDALTGSWYEFEQRYVNAILKRQQP